MGWVCRIQCHLRRHICHPSPSSPPSASLLRASLAPSPIVREAGGRSSGGRVAVMPCGGISQARNVTRRLAVAVWRSEGRARPGDWLTLRVTRQTPALPAASAPVGTFRLFRPSQRLSLHFDSSGRLSACRYISTLPAASAPVATFRRMRMAGLIV